MAVSDNSYAITQAIQALKKKKLLIDDGEKSRLDLTAFNRNLENASKNLGTIIPSIIEVSKEQVALINNGLEGTINFIKAFQTFNTAFAAFVEQPEIFEKKYKGKMEQLESLEKTIMDEVKDNLSGLNEMLTETFREVSVYYTALGHIIYSEEEGGAIEVGYNRSNALAEKMGKIYTRKDNHSKGFSMEKSLGLVQIIQSLIDIEKEVKHIRIDDIETSQYYIQGKTGENESRIKIDIDVIIALKGISNELLSSLKSAGVLIENESTHINEIKSDAFKQKSLAENGLNAVREIIGKLGEHAKVTHFFRNNFGYIKKISGYSIAAKDKEQAKIYDEVAQKEKENSKAKEVHDRIIKNQMDLIIKVVNSFGSIISLWGDQVNNEISIAQVADKAVIAIDRLSRVEIKEDINVEGLLIAKKTQKAIGEACSYASELKNVGKVMQMLLGRVKSLLSYNKGLESQIRMFHSSKDEAKDYAYEKLHEIKSILYEKYPKISKNVSATLDEFNKKMESLSKKKNQKENQDLINNLISSYERIGDNVQREKIYIEAETKIISSDIAKFEESCKNLGERLNITDDSIDSIFDSFKGFRKTFFDDFEVYMKLSQDYRELIGGISPMLDLMSYMISMQKQLGQQKIELRVINQSLKAFVALFGEMKKIQAEERLLDNDLMKVMKDAKLSKMDYYEDYKKKLGSFRELFEELESEVIEYFKDAQSKTGKAYSLANEWMSSFEVNFRDYNKELKSMNIGFFEKLFKTQSYKEKDFWQDIKEVRKSFDATDKRINNLSKLNLKKPKNVAEFCKFSIDFVNQIFTGYKDLIVEVNRIVQVMHLVNENLSKIQSTKLESFSGMIKSFKKFNSQLDELEDQTVNLEEFDRLNVDNMLKSLSELTDFKKLENVSRIELEKLNKIKGHAIQDVEDLRNQLLVFYTTYLTKALHDGKEKEKYSKIYEEAKSKL
jgi:hypothetical protein